MKFIERRPLPLGAFFLEETCLARVNYYRPTGKILTENEQIIMVSIWLFYLFSRYYVYPLNGIIFASLFCEAF
jgi:hypothetical protein